MADRMQPTSWHGVRDFFRTTVLQAESYLFVAAHV
jgi:hypothetical protein